MNKLFLVTVLAFGLTPLVQAEKKNPGKMGGPPLFKEIDANADGSLSWEEFMAPHENKLKARFDKMDENKDGVLTQPEYKKGRMVGHKPKKAGKAKEMKEAPKE